MGRVIAPFQTHIDGDLTIVIGTGEREVDTNRIGLLAAEALQEAVINAVCKADGFGLLPRVEGRLLGQKGDRTRPGRALSAQNRLDTAVKLM